MPFERKIMSVDGSHTASIIRRQRYKFISYPQLPPWQKCIRNVMYLKSQILTDDRDDVKTNLLHQIVPVYIVVCRFDEVVLFLLRYKFFRIPHVRRTPGFNFAKDDVIDVFGNNVYLQMSVSPIGFPNGVIVFFLVILRNLLSLFF